MENINLHKQMLTLVAKALGPELLDKVAFVGGCTTGLFLTDAFTKEQVRYTEDVDLIIDVVGRIGWHQFEGQLRQRGFEDDQDMLCRMRLDSLKVDFMPSDGDILGFSNCWYARALGTAEEYPLSDDLTIRLITPPYFLATKLEAYRGRGNNDPLESRDIEDLLNVIDGRPEIIYEISQTDSDLRAYIANQLRELLDNPSFEYAVQSASHSEQDREKLLFERIETISQLGSPAPSV